VGCNSSTALRVSVASMAGLAGKVAPFETARKLAAPLQYTT
jgi:hypothetical protein